MKWVALLIFGGIGLTILVCGLLWAAKRWPLFRHGLRTKGTVVSQAEVTSVDLGERTGTSQTTTAYFPVVEFQAEGGQKVTFQGSTGGVGSPQTPTGSEVEVIYDSRDPSNAQIGSFTHFWLGPAATSAFGLVFLLMGIGGFVLIGKSDKALGPDLRERMARDAIAFNPGSIRVQGTIREIRPVAGSGKWVLVCKGLPPGASFEKEFESESLPFEPKGDIVGRSVTIYLDPRDQSRYLVELGPLLPELMKR